MKPTVNHPEQDFVVKLEDYLYLGSCYQESTEFWKKVGITHTLVIVDINDLGSQALQNQDKALTSNVIPIAFAKDLAIYFPPIIAWIMTVARANGTVLVRGLEMEAEAQAVCAYWFIQTRKWTFEKTLDHMVGIDQFIFPDQEQPFGAIPPFWRPVFKFQPMFSDIERDMIQQYGDLISISPREYQSILDSFFQFNSKPTQASEPFKKIHFKRPSHHHTRATNPEITPSALNRSSIQNESNPTLNPSNPTPSRPSNSETPNLPLKPSPPQQLVESPPISPRAVEEKRPSLFGRSLVDSIQPPLLVPKFLFDGLLFVEGAGMDTVGIFRIAGERNKVKQALEILVEGSAFDFRTAEVPVVCTLIKQFLRDLKEPLCTFEYAAEFLHVPSEPASEQKYTLKNLIDNLDPPNSATLQFLVSSIKRITKFTEQHQMTASSLASLFAPNILFRKPDQPSNLLADARNANLCLEAMIEHHEFIFSGIKKQTLPAGQPIVESKPVSPIEVSCSPPKGNLPKPLPIPGQKKNVGTT